MEWQPIETAPKERNMLLSDGCKVSEGGWISDVDQGAEYEGQCGMAGWWSVECIERPTHWMPLPEPPNVQAADVLSNVNRHSPATCEKCGTVFEVAFIDGKPKSVAS